ncbi:GspH/FimT family pseudopilin [Pseudomonas sp. NA-150]|uniref:GspH/FimT family pseudopilin n=1 Tax=Pseudomonas sp. NA-150 TaxID=3367525 RepID=UPI0037C712F0
MNQAGLGLVQLLVGMALVAILASIAVPGFAQVIETQRRADAAQQLASAIRSARTEAILRNQVVWVQALEGDWSRGWRIVVERNDAEDPVLMERTSVGKVRIVGNYWVSQQVRFNGMGAPISAGGAWNSGTLFICEKGRPISHHQVVLSSTGRVKVDSGKADEPLCR